MPLRGKILNTFDLDLSEAYENEEVKAIFTLIGTGGGSSFNIKKMKYDKVIIAADGDADGSHIALLIIALFLKHAPQVIEDGRLYQLIPPFYAIGDKILFSDKELEDYKAKHGEPKNLERYKGLGSIRDDEMAEKYLMNPETRKIIQIKMDDLEEMKEVFEVILGKDIEGRRKLVRTGVYND